MLIALSPTRRVSTTILGSRFKLVNGRPQRRWMNFDPHKKSTWRALPWDQKIYLRLLQEHRQALDTKQADVLSWVRPLTPFIMRRGTILYAITLQHYVILLNGVSLSTKLDDPKQEPVLTADAFMLTSSIRKDNNLWRIFWGELDTSLTLEPAQSLWDIHVRTEYDLRPEDNPNLPLTKVSRFFNKEGSRPIVEVGSLTIPIKYLTDPVPRRWFSVTEESMGRLDPFTEVGPRTRDLLAFCPTLCAPEIGLIDAHYHGRSSTFSVSGRWPFENRTCLVFSHQGTLGERKRAHAAAEKLAQRFKELGRVRTTKVAMLWLNGIIEKVLPYFDNGHIPAPKIINLSRVLIARALEKYRGTTILIHIPRDMPKIPFRQLVELASGMQEDTAVIVSVVGRKPYSAIFDHESGIVRETFATEIVFRPPLKPAAVIEELEPEATPEEDAMMKRLMEKFLSQHEQRKVRQREEAEKIRRLQEHQERIAAIQKEMEQQRKAETQKRIEEEKQAEERRIQAQREELRIREGVEGWYEAAVQHEIEASLREQGLDTVRGTETMQDLDGFTSAEETEKDTDQDTEEAQPSEGSISIENGDICIEKEGSITVMDGFLNKRDGSIVIKTGFVNMDSGTIVFLRRSDLAPFREDLTKMSISFEDGISRPTSGGSSADKEDFTAQDDGNSDPDLMSLTDAVIDITDGSVEIQEGSIKVIGEEGFDDAKKILSSIRIKRGAIHIVSGSATFKDGKEGFINCSFNISETTLDFNDGFSDVKEVDDAVTYSVRNWGIGYQPIIDGNGSSYNNWSYDPIVKIRDTAKERVFKRQEAIEEAARVEAKAEAKARMERERLEEEERLRKEMLAKRRAEMLARLPMSFLRDRKRKDKD